MDNRPIGVFDSGLGGLTAVKQLMKKMPDERIVYFGDTGRVPYGTRSRETLIRYTSEAIDLLKSKNVKRILIACGTASTVLEAVPHDGSVPVSGVLYAASRAAVAATRNKKVGLIATARSIHSGEYERIIASLDPSVQVFGKACPLLVPIIEAGRISLDDEVCRLVVSEYLEEIKQAGVDTLILGCTHYPIIRGVIDRVMEGSAALIDAGAAAAEDVKRVMTAEGSLADGRCAGTEFYVSDFPEGFAAVGSMFLGREITGAVEKIDLPTRG